MEAGLWQKSRPDPMISNLDRSMRILVVVSLLTAVALTVIVWLLLRQVSRPVTARGHWTRSLNIERLAAPASDFSYPELNELAELIRTSLSAVQEGLEREQAQPLPPS